MFSLISGAETQAGGAFRRCCFGHLWGWDQISNFPFSSELFLPASKSNEKTAFYFLSLLLSLADIV